MNIMAVLSRPSLRSSARRDADPESPATENPPRPSESRKGKRARPSPPGHDSDTSSKKLRTEPHNETRKLNRQKRDVLKTLPFRSRQPLNKDNVVTQPKARKLDPVLIQPKNGLHLTAKEHSDDESPHHGINQNIPPPTPTHAGGRSLRSHAGGSRSKSELAQYFGNYDDLISIEAREPGEYYSE